jgi:hypothetical protein
MDRITAQSSEVLLARMNRELERISDVQHRLARRRLVLQQQATRLRLGASPLEVRLTLRAAALDEEERNRLTGEWSEEPRMEGDEHHGGTLL